MEKVIRKYSFRDLFTVPNKIKATFQHDCLKKNQLSILFASFLVFLFETFNIIRVLFFSPSKLGTLNNQIYFTFYCSLIGIAILSLILSYYFKRNRRVLAKVQFFAALTGMVWHVLLNAYDLSRNPNADTIVFISAVFGLSILVQWEPVKTLSILGIGYGLFLFLAYSFLSIGTIINLTVFVFVAMFICVSRFLHQISNLTQQKKITRMNKQLSMEKERLRLSLEQHQIIMRQSNDIMFDWDIANDCIEFSDNWTNLFQQPASVEQLSKAILETPLLRETDRTFLFDILLECKQGTRSFAEYEFQLLNSAQQSVWYHARVSLQYDAHNHPIKGFGTLVNIDKQRKHLEALTTQAERDPLTDLLNKKAIKTYSEKYLNNLPTESCLAMLIVDMDNFKYINDTFGHPCGDYVLSQVAQVLKSIFRKEDLLGRIGGDEFAIVLPHIKNVTIIHQRVNQLIDALSKIQWEDQEINSACSVGIAVTSSQTISFESLYHNADSALYEAKHSGKGCYFLYQESTESAC